MKLQILSIALFSSIALCAQNSNELQKTQPQTSTKVDVDDKDGQVVAQSMGTMIQALATFSQDPKNPVVAGTCALQALGAFITMIIQIFDDFAPARNLRTQEEIEYWFTNLPKEKQIQIMQLMVAYVHTQKRN
ncbi:MAG: hypothetical protein AMXMBFR12_08620 [Candidatus Babeliales bacterium]